MISDGRVRLIYLPEHLVLDLIRGRVAVDMEELPEDATFVAAHYDFKFAGLAIRIHSKTFEPVENGFEIPNLTGREWFSVRLKEGS